MRLVSTIMLVLLVACSAAFSIGVADFSVPIGNSFEKICWEPVDASSAPRVRTATYRALATYDPGSLGLTERVEVQFFGRSVAPASTCTTPDEVTDMPLSEVFALERENSQAIEIGGAAYGTTLGNLVNDEPFWLGATAAGNIGVGERLNFEDGRVFVGF